MHVQKANSVRSTRHGWYAGIRCLLVGLVLVGLTNVAAIAQTIYGNISGRVTDQTGAAIVGARIEVKNMDTGETREVVSGSDGTYTVRSLPGGRYAVRISADSFETLVREQINVTAARDAIVDAELKAGSSQEVITVTGEATLIETTRSQVSKEVDARRILQLPGRNTLNGLALLQPGVVNNQNGRPGSGFAVNGARTRSNNFLIDGTQNNDPSLSIPVQNLPPEALAEFQIITNNFSAEFGRNGGAIVQQITRSGTNEFSGIAHYTWEGNGLNALTTAQQRTFSAARAQGFSERDALRRARAVNVTNIWGGTFGGPIKKDKIFFFTSFDRNTFRTTAVPITVALAPSGIAALQAYATANPSGPNALAPGALTFLTNTFPVANDPTPRGTITVRRPSDNAIVATIPVQQFNRALTGSLPYGRNFWRILVKGDVNLTNNDRFSLRYLQDRSRDPGAPTAIPGNEIGTNVDNYNGAVNYIRTFSPRVVNEFRFSFVDRALNFPENLPPAITIGGFNSVGNANFPQFRNSRVIEFTDALTWTFSKHTLKFGGSYNRINLDSFFAPNFRGTVSYGSLSDLLFDRNASFSQYAGTGLVPARVNEMGVFIQDDYRILPSLTLNLGLRYEYVSAPFGFFSNAEPDINNFAPRVGFAWNPRVEGDGFIATMLGKDKTVIRGGYGISYDQIFLNILLNNSRNFPRGVNIAIGPITGQRLYVPANRPAPPTPSQFTGDPNLLPVRLYSPNKRVALPYQQSFNFGFERQLWNDYVFRMFYIGSRGLKLVREVETNLGFNITAINNNPSFYANILPQLRPVLNASGQTIAFRRDPSRGSILIGDGLASSWYHSLQLTLGKRFRNGIQYELNYTWSAFINDSDDILGGQTNSTLPANPLNFRQDRARSGLDQPHRFVANYTFELPRINISNPFFDRLINGWAMSGISTFSSGTPFSVLNAFNALGILPGQISTVELSQRVSINPAGQPGTATGFPGVTNPFYVANPVNSGINGNSGRNILRTGGVASTDFAFVKRFRTFGERQALEVRWEVFNVFNRRNFTVIPSNTVNNATNPALFLNLGQTNVGGRSMIFTARYIF
ncbi:TonB-dependent Receptor Plug Domain protein [Chloracidobacterium thermophilum B]|uniref:TonB-dependent Receptor Plug Domain protein n=1 Tax=Chloracidobacterium thermophilum (strain B) TaxID=981222 RepID=G2LG81_CHLTF|nr:TonB-dependent Receptor Plug Domain protein [Chloracidobacterium thermophilum B]